MSKWNNRKWHWNTWKWRATCASIKLNIDIEGVIIGNVSRMRSRSNLSQHKQSFRVSFSVSFLSHVVDRVVNALQIDCHPFCDLLFTWRWHSCSIFVFNNIKFSIPSMIITVPCIDSKHLTNLKFYFSDRKLWLRVVDSYFCAGNFVWIEYVFVEFYLKPTGSLGAAATCGQRYILFILRVLNELNRWLMDDKHLLIF